MSMKMPTYSMELQLLWNSIQRFRIHHRNQLVGGLYYTVLHCTPWLPFGGVSDYSARCVIGKPYKATSGRWKYRHKHTLGIDLEVDDLLRVTTCFVNNGRVRSALTVLSKKENVFQVWCMLRYREMDEESWDYFNRLLYGVSKELVYTGEYIQP